MHTALLLPCMIVHVNDHSTKPPPPPFGSPPSGDPPEGDPKGNPPSGNPPSGGSPKKHHHITCSNCKKSYPEEAFRGRTKRNCKMCQRCRDIGRRYGLNPKNKRARRRAWYLEQKRKFMSRGCEWPGGCSLSNVPFMQVHGEYDHVDRTEKFKLSDWDKKHSLTEEDFKKEEAKCRALCPCHHARHSHEQRQEEDKDYSQDPEAVYSRAARARGRAHNNMRKRKRGECFLCHLPVVAGEESMFEWDHLGLVSGNKHRPVSAMLQCALSTIDEEIAKCRLLDRNCHAQWTPEQAKQANAQGLKAVLPKKRKLVRYKKGCVSFHKQTQKWQAKGPSPQRKWLGLHPTKEAAWAAIAKYKAEHHEEFGMRVFGK